MLRVVAILLTVVVVLSCGGSTDPTPSPSPAPTASPSPSPTPNAKNIAKSLLVVLQDLPSGFRDQGSNVESGDSSNGIQAVGTVSFSRSLTTAQGLQGLAITVGGIAVVCNDESIAKERSTAEYIKNILTLTAYSTYGISDGDAAVISFPNLGDETVAVELSGTGVVSDQSAEFGLRVVAIRQGRVVVTIQTTSLGLGPLSELEEIARSVSGRMSSISQ